MITKLQGQENLNCPLSDITIVRERRRISQSLAEDSKGNRMSTNLRAIKICTSIETECGHCYHLNLSNLAFVMMP